MLVVLEGVDGLGKSAIISAVRKALPLNNVVICSDPGNIFLLEAIRSL